MFINLQANFINSSMCEAKNMIDIECRVTDTHMSSKATGLNNVECSLERGLYCENGPNEPPCPNFEIRVLCQCGKFIITF